MTKFVKIMRASTLVAVLLALCVFLSGCGSDETSMYCLSAGSTLYSIDSESGTVSWSCTFDDTYQLLYCTPDADTVYVGYSMTGADHGRIVALNAKTGETQWQTDCSVCWAPWSCMQYLDGVLYYPGTYDASASAYQLFALDLDTMEETALNAYHSQVTNFSIYDSKIYTNTSDGIVAYDIGSGSTTVVGELENTEYTFLCFYEDTLVVVYRENVEYYTVTGTSLEAAATVTAEDLGVDSFSACAAGPAAFLYLERALGDLSQEAMFCAYRLDTAEVIEYEMRDDGPYDAAFTDDGFYAVFSDGVWFYGWDGTVTFVSER